MIALDRGGSPSTKNKGRAGDVLRSAGNIGCAICLFRPACSSTAWAEPANPIFEFTGSAAADNVDCRAKDRGSCRAVVTRLPSFSSSAANRQRCARPWPRVNSCRDRAERPEAELQASAASTKPAVTAANFRLSAEFPPPRRRPVPHELVCETLADAAVDQQYCRRRSSSG